jgi:hypothetical protein
MQIDILFETPTLEEMKKQLNIHFNQAIKIHQEKLSMFEQYQIRPVERHIPEVWKYRVVCKGGIYYFGTLNSL